MKRSTPFARPAYWQSSAINRIGKVYFKPGPEEGVSDLPGLFSKGVDSNAEKQ